MIPTVDILTLVCSQKEKPFSVGFATETQNALKNAKQKRIKKDGDMIVVNDVSRSDIGFGCDQNAVTIVTKDEIMHIEKNSKENIAYQLLQIIFENYKNSRSSEKI